MNIPYMYRIVALIVVSLAIVAYSRWKNPENKQTAKEYGTLWAMALLGAIYGGIHDAATCTISPLYFIAAKGLPEGEGLFREAIFLGMKAGFSAGAILGAFWLFASQKNGHSQPEKICKFAWIPIVAAAISAHIFPLIFASWDPLEFGKNLGGIFSYASLGHFRFVWWAHVGSYCGAIVGFILGILLVRKT